MRCPNCGSQIEEEDVFCAECGYKIESGQISRPKNISKGKSIPVMLISFALIIILCVAFLSFLDRDGEEEIQNQENEIVEINEIDEIEQDEEEELSDSQDVGKEELKEGEAIIEEETIEEEDYIIKNSDSCYLTRDDIKGLNLQQLNYAKNEIYARHGRKFKSKELMDYFESKPWYEGKYDPDVFDKTYSKNLLNDYEKKNAELLSEREYELDPNGYQLDAN